MEIRADRDDKDLEEFLDRQLIGAAQLSNVASVSARGLMGRRDSR